MTPSGDKLFFCNKFSTLFLVIEVEVRFQRICLFIWRSNGAQLVYCKY